MLNCLVFKTTFKTLFLCFMQNCCTNKYLPSFENRRFQQVFFFFLLPVFLQFVVSITTTTTGSQMHLVEALRSSIPIITGKVVLFLRNK